VLGQDRSRLGGPFASLHIKREDEKPESDIRRNDYNSVLMVDCAIVWFFLFVILSPLVSTEELPVDELRDIVYM
jgi:hypothetical protein